MIDVTQTTIEPTDVTHAAPTVYSVVQSPVGELLLVGCDGALVGVYFPEHARGPAIDAAWQRDDAALEEARRQLGEYFAGGRRTFTLRLAADGTPFQRQVWAGLARIPFGATSTYAELAREVGRPGAARAVGAAVGRNPLSIVVPCHRVVGTSGALTGYAGGMDRKRHLLALEQG
jgi:methylated-DNA-[protein]-cysteine S-methyltransferase